MTGSGFCKPVQPGGICDRWSWILAGREEIYAMGSCVPGEEIQGERYDSSKADIFVILLDVSDKARHSFEGSGGV